MVCTGEPRLFTVTSCGLYAPGPGTAWPESGLSAAVRPRLCFIVTGSGDVERNSSGLYSPAGQGKQQSTALHLTCCASTASALAAFHLSLAAAQPINDCHSKHDFCKVLSFNWATAVLECPTSTPASLRALLLLNAALLT
jgi:hypothetical protein